MQVIQVRIPRKSSIIGCRPQADNISTIPITEGVNLRHRRRVFVRIPKIVKVSPPIRFGIIYFSGVCEAEGEINPGVVEGDVGPGDGMIGCCDDAVFTSPVTPGGRGVDDHDIDDRMVIVLVMAPRPTPGALA